MHWHEDDDFWAVFGPILFNAKRMAAAAPEVDGFLRLAAPLPGPRVPDMACSPGRHSLELARRGYRVTGVDRTTRYLEQLSSAAQAEDLDIEVVRRDMRDFRRPRGFDAALIWFTSLGYFEDPEDDHRALVNLHDSLVPGGRLAVDVLGKEIAARGFFERWWQWLDPDQLLLEERDVTRSWTWMNTRWTLLRGGERSTWGMAQRLWSASELVSAMERAGFVDVCAYGSLEGEPYDRRAWRLIVVGERSA